jgi:mannitol/fructose-specific phosphotransferase system IIA component (Ntr-type)
MKLSDIVVDDACIAQLDATTRDEAIKELVQSLADAGAITKKSVDEVTKAVIKREEGATTGIGKGIALPHVKLPAIKKPIAAIGLAPEGIDFNSLDAKPVFSVILLLSSSEQPEEHLQAMEAIFRHVQRDIFRKFLSQAETQEAIVDLVNEADDLGS